MPPKTIQGACSWGAVTLEATLPTLWVAHCHCENCRRAHGAGFVTYAGFPADKVHFTHGEANLTVFLTPTGATRRFCKTCGSTLIYESPRWKGEIHLPAANLDELDRLPAGHAYADRAPAWCPITDTLPQRGGPDGVTPLESL